MTQHIIQGINQLPKILNGIGITNLFIVTGSRSYASLNFKELIDSLEMRKVFFTDFTPNPLFEQVCKGIDLFEAEKCDGILSIGGGSAMDVAKCIKVSVLAEEGRAALIPPLVNTDVKIDGAKIPFIAIPTTAGTGSESTHNAVMYYDGSKQTITNDGVLPDFAILESSVLKTLPVYQKKCTMMDALSQSIESWWSINSTEESYEYSCKAIELIMQNWESYIFDNDSDASAKIMLGANYGGRAINITATTAAHAMSYKITSLYNYPHGHAVACCLPSIWKYMIGNIENIIDPRGIDYLNGIFSHIASAMGCKSVEEAIIKFEEMMSLMELQQPMLNSPEELDILAQSVNPTRLKNNPVYLSEEVLRKLYIDITK